LYIPESVLIRVMSAINHSVNIPISRDTDEYTVESILIHVTYVINHSMNGVV